MWLRDYNLFVEIPCLLFEAGQDGGTAQLLHPPAPSQPSAIYQAPPTQPPYRRMRIPMLFHALRCGQAHRLSRADNSVAKLLRSHP